MTKDMIVSFSGGRTSAFMAWWLKENKSNDYNLKFAFANTGQEHERTLEFVDKCDRFFGLDLIWVEAAINDEKGKGTRHKIVSYEDATRDHAIFEKAIKKYGLPNPDFPWCTRELKQAPMSSLYKHLGLKNPLVAIGIRADEMDRISVNAKKNNLIYPLVSMLPTTKKNVLDFWQNMPFDLQIKEHEGNCLWCWKKSNRKIMTNMVDNPQWFDFILMAEEKYKSYGAGNNDRKMLRNYQSFADLKALSEKPFNKFIEHIDHQAELFDEYLDLANSCAESCEVFNETN